MLITTSIKEILRSKMIVVPKSTIIANEQRLIKTSQKLRVS